MWEGFETLYLEYLNDPECTLTVIPAIIFEKNVNGDGINPVCHTKGFPDYVHITTLDNYDFAKELPDVIYIQNAQDNDNFGISLHPALYTKELKKYTKELVYVPYSVYDEAPLSDAYALSEAKPILIPERIGNVDRVIVQSKAMKDAWIQLIAGSDPALIDLWDKKISYEDYPRTRLIKLLRKEDIAAPDEWLRHMFYAQVPGNKQPPVSKKIILYSNAVSVTLCEDRNAFRKMRSVIDYFADRYDLCLLWRPHPELVGILKRLRPYIVSEYEELLEYYKSCDIGILDDSTTPTAAIVLSDMYFGDPCAAAELYKVTEKPMLLENMRRKDDDLSALISFLDT